MDPITGHASLWLTVTPVAWTLFVGWILWKLPGWVRVRDLFGYTLPDDPGLVDRRDAVVAWYRRWILATTVLWTGVSAAAAFGGRPGPAYLALTALGFTFVGVYLGARRRARRLVPEALELTPEEEAGPPASESALERPGLPGGAVGQAGPFVLWVAAAAGLWMSGKGGLREVLAPLLMGFVFLVGLRVGARMLRNQSRPPSTEGDVARLRLSLAAMLGAEYLLVTTFGLIAAMPALEGALGSEGTLVVLLAGPHLLTLVFVVWLVVRASGLPKHDADATDRMADRHWKAGLVYSNPDDPAVWVEKRFGIGYTLNFARSGAWWFLVAVVGIPLLATLLLALVL